MKNRSNKKSEVECAFFLYFPRHLREVSKQDGKFHGLLMSDAYAPRTREQALAYLEKSKAVYDSTPAWDLGVGYSYHLQKSYLEDPKSECCWDIDNFVREVILFAEKEDSESLVKSALCFFDKHPMLEGFYGYVPMISHGIEIKPLFFICRNCRTTTPWRRGNVWKEPTCCESPWIERVCEVVLRHVGEFAITVRRIGGYKDALEKLFKAEFGERQALERSPRKRRPRVLYGQKTETKHRKLSRQRDLQRIREEVRHCVQEIRKARKNPKYDSKTIRWLRENGLNLDAKIGRLKGEIAKLKLVEFRKRHPGETVPEVETILRGPRRRSK